MFEAEDKELEQTLETPVEDTEASVVEETPDVVPEKPEGDVTEDEEAQLEAELAKAFGMSDERTLESLSPETTEEEGVEDTTSEEASVEEPTDKDAVSLFMEQYGDKIQEEGQEASDDAEASPTAALEQEIAQVDAWLNQDFFSQLPALDRDMQFIYNLDPKALNEYLIDLKDEGKELLAAQVQQAYIQAENLAKQKQAVTQYRTTLKQRLEAELQQSRIKAQEAEWIAVEEEIKTGLPELSDAQQKRVYEHLERLSKTQKDFTQRTADRDGKVAAVVTALNKLGILEELKAAKAASEESSGDKPVKKTTPSVPDARAAIKKVNTTTTAKSSSINGKRIADMSQEEFNKLDPAVAEKAVDEELAALLRQ